MAYQDLPSLESQPPSMRREEDPQYRDDPAFDQLAESLGDQIESLQGKVSRLDIDINNLGTKKDNPRLRERVRNVLEEAFGELRDAGERFNKISKWDCVNSTQAMKRHKLVTHYKSVLAQFETLNRRQEEKARAIATAAHSAAESSGQPHDDAGFQLQDQQLLEPELANQDEVDYQYSEINRRGEEIDRIASTVDEMSGLFKKVAHMVEDQGEEMDRIDQNTQTVAQDTRNARAELRSASQYQKNARGKACCLFVILAIILTIIVLAVVLG